MPPDFIRGFIRGLIRGFIRDDSSLIGQRFSMTFTLHRLHAFRALIGIFLMLATVPAFAQDPVPSIHQIESAFYSAHPELAEPKVLPKRALPADLQETVQLKKAVYGFHPYWQNGSETNYAFSLLSHLVYFSGDIIDSTGGFSSTHNWATASVVSDAQRYGTKVHFAVTLFGGHAKLLNSPTARQNLINNILIEINRRNADGCNVDFERIDSTLAVQFRSFIYDLGVALHGAGKELTVELPAVDWSKDKAMFGSSFLALTNPVVDLYFIMLYDYYWSGSSTAGPVAPLSVANYNVTKSIDYYLDVGYPASKLIAGYPYYGLDWPVVSDARMAAATASANSRTYTAVKNNYIDTIAASNKFFDATYSVPWYRYQTAGGWRQTWYDDSASLALKYDLVASRNLGGTGMWALGYDGTEPELWRLLKAKFAEPVIAGRSVFDDFEASVGRFDRSPTYSGSTTGIATSSYAVFTNDVAKSGLGALLVSLVDNASSTSDWNVRLLSASGNAAGNVAVTMPGRIGFWLKTATASPSAELGIAVDDGATLLRSPRLSVINDGEWHFYEWDLEETEWKVFTTGVDTVVIGPTVTLDAVMFYAPNGSSAWTSFVDEVGYAPTTAVGKEAVSVPAEFELENNWPNPFNPSTQVGVRIPESGIVKLAVFDLLGREVAVLMNEFKMTGYYTATWNAIGFASGVYFCQLQAGGRTITKKMLLQK